MPTILPPGYDPASCIQRNWLITLRTPFKSRVMDLQLDYLQEDSKRQELGSDRIEQNLKLWVLDGQRWYTLKTHINPLSNVISTKNMTINPSQMLRFVACSENKESK